MEIERRYKAQAVTIPNGQATSEVIDMRPFSGGIVSMPAAWTAASIAFQHSPSPTGTFQPLKDSGGNLVEITAGASGDFMMPDAVFACQFVKLQSETGGAAVNQGADRAITVSLKG